MKDVYNKRITNLNLFYSSQLRWVYNKRKFKGNYQVKQSSNLKEMIVKLYEMGFQDDKVERAFLYADAGSIEEVVSYILPNEKGFWDHKFIPDNQINPNQKCLLCRRNENKIKIEGKFDNY